MTYQIREICSLVHKQILPVERGTSAVIGSVFSLAESDTKNANGTSHKQIVKNARTWKKRMLSYDCYEISIINIYWNLLIM